MVVITHGLSLTMLMMNKWKKIMRLKKRIVDSKMKMKMLSQEPRVRRTESQVGLSPNLIVYECSTGDESESTSLLARIRVMYISPLLCFRLCCFLLYLQERILLSFKWFI